MSDAAPADPDERIEHADGAEAAVWEALSGVEDPELPVSIVDLGLIYDLSVADGRADVDLTLTYTGCPARDLIELDVERAVRSVPGIEEVAIELVFSPPWTHERITDRGREALREHGLAVPDGPGPEPDCRT